ncbi:Microsomal triglyceride transfer protein large subunit [Anopheles sinensis]|uniref:Microsomal triglyceride transfer protein large subunit n=1 Tax=Anopheles sinensis TaxID=74873 RepID=A0A084VK93_ANOSI|nr:Microsomal triglyceride transfer protein large subunit [Anopheles sinensis]
MAQSCPGTGAESGIRIRRNRRNSHLWKRIHPTTCPEGRERNGGNNGRDCAPKTDMRISSNNSAKRMGGTQLRRFWGEDDKTIM